MWYSHWYLRNLGVSSVARIAPMQLCIHIYTCTDLSVASRERCKKLSRHPKECCWLLLHRKTFSTTAPPTRRMANRSGRDGMFLKASDRESLLRQFARFEKRKSRTAVVAGVDYRGVEEAPMKDGCRVCKKDNDHSNMLLCEKCSAEYHFYCIGLKTVPTEDWFCGR